MLGKQIIHPAQIDAVNTAFSPEAKQIDYADRLVKAFEDHQISGKVSLHQLILTFNSGLIQYSTIFPNCIFIFQFFFNFFFILTWKV